MRWLQVADFGMAKLLKEGEPIQGTRVQGTYGYLAPEYAIYGQVSGGRRLYNSLCMSNLQTACVLMLGLRRPLLLRPGERDRLWAAFVRQFVCVESLQTACFLMLGVRRPSK
jgi:hypothetical protein